MKHRTNGSWATGGTLVAALLSSACCWLPLALIAFGVSGAAASAALEPWRPLFVALTVAFLGTAFYLTYRKPGVRTTSESTDTTADCCSTEPGPSRLQRWNRRALWIVAPLALAFVSFPSYASALLGSSEPTGAVSETAQVHSLRIEGMTCEGCAGILERALVDVPGVIRARVDYETGTAEVATEPDGRVPYESLATAVEEAGYSVLP